MTESDVQLEHFDGWLNEDGEIAALVMRQYLVPIEGKDAVIFPPTYPIDEKQNKPGYNIDCFDGGVSVCQIDSVGSQANRMEPIFKREKYRHLVPQVSITAKISGGERTVHLLDAGHRAADAIVRFSALGPRLHAAFMAIREDGNAELLARIAPTSIVFGSWDSRATQVKLPRVVRSVIRAYGVRELHRSAQYSTIAGEILEDGDAEVTTKGPKAELGLAHVPAVRAPGGIQVLGELRREAILNLSAIRALAASSKAEGGANTLALRRYIFGLALVCFAAPAETILREGCELVPDSERPAQWKKVSHDGTRADFTINHPTALKFATMAADAFGVEAPQEHAFSSEIANQVLGLSERDRKKLLRQGPVTKEAIEQLSKESSGKGKSKGSQEKA